jgi:Tfp pilus assembly protein PilN
MNGSTVITKVTTLASTSSSILKRIWEPLWKILSFSLANDAIYPARVLSASLDKGTLSVVHGSRFLSRITVKGVREYSFEEGKYPQPEVFASSLSLAINDLGASKAEVSLSIPKAWTVIKLTDFPVTVKENLANVVSYELDRLTPFSSEDAFYDFKILGEHEGKLIISVIAAKAEFVRPYINALREKGIVVSRVTVNLSCLETLCRYVDKRADSVFMEIKKDGYEGALFLGGSITTASAGNYTSEDEHAKAETIMTAISNFTDTVKRYGKSPQIMLLFRDKSPTLRELLKSNIGQPVKILNDTNLKIGFSGQYKEIPYAAVGGALGSLWQKADGLNLLSKGYYIKPATPKVFTIILLIAILIMWILYLIAPLRVEERRLQEIDRQIALRKEEVKKVEALKKETERLDSEISTIINFKEGRPMALNVLKELTTVLPKNAWTARMRISQTNVDLEGYAASATGILSKLEASPYFRKVEFASPTFRDARINADRFNIKMEIEGIEKEEKKVTEEGELEEE